MNRILIKTRKEIPGTLRQEAYCDRWQESIDIETDLDLGDPAVQERIKNAFYKSENCQKAGSLWGALRAPGADSVAGFDVEKKQMIINCYTRLCD